MAGAFSSSKNSINFVKKVIKKLKKTVLSKRVQLFNETSWNIFFCFTHKTNILTIIYFNNDAFWNYRNIWVEELFFCILFFFDEMWPATSNAEPLRIELGLVWAVKGGRCELIMGWSFPISLPKRKSRSGPPFLRIKTHSLRFPIDSSCRFLSFGSGDLKWPCDFGWPSVH